MFKVIQIIYIYILYNYIYSINVVNKNIVKCMNPLLYFKNEVGCIKPCVIAMPGNIFTLMLILFSILLCWWCQWKCFLGAVSPKLTICPAKLFFLGIQFSFLHQLQTGPRLAHPFSLLELEKGASVGGHTRKRFCFPIHLLDRPLFHKTCAAVYTCL